ncbi:MAG: hypothetical protein P4L56_16385 [Candidatus Sulfopaludibacter sp.]|nr:hypothetical protein [Candidatus Sulfopaludibacter sp.]
MWLFTRYGFFSIACADRAGGGLDPQNVMIRARCEGHLRNLQTRFPAIGGAEIVILPECDYRYRLIVPKASWVPMIGELANEQDWSNFKDEAARFQGSSGRGYVSALHRVWEVMYRLQMADRK